MKRLRFMQASPKKLLRVCSYLLPPKRRIVRDVGRVVTVMFAVKMEAGHASGCDALIQRAFEDCGDFEREICKVELDSKIEHTDIDFYDVHDSAARVFSLKNTTIERLMCRREDGQVVLYFQTDIALKSNRGVGHFTDQHFGHDVFCEFVPSQIFPEEAK